MPLNEQLVDEWSRFIDIFRFNFIQGQAFGFKVAEWVAALHLTGDKFHEVGPTDRHLCAGTGADDGLFRCTVAVDECSRGLLKGFDAGGFVLLFRDVDMNSPGNELMEGISTFIDEDVINAFVSRAWAGSGTNPRATTGVEVLSEAMRC